MSNRVTQPTATIEDARHALCHRLAEVIRQGDVGMQVRFVQEGETSLIWIYSKKDHEWRKRDDLAIDAHLTEPLFDLCEGLFAQKYADAWTCHRTDHSDRTDFELKFSRESIEPHVKGNLDSYLLGCLSHEHHDSGRDSRRRIHFRKG